MVIYILRVVPAYHPPWKKSEILLGAALARHHVQSRSRSRSRSRVDRRPPIVFPASFQFAGHSPLFASCIYFTADR